MNRIDAHGSLLFDGGVPDPSVFTKAEALARLPRNQASTPFARNADTRLWHFADIPTREQALLAVRDIYEGNWTPHIDPMPGETYAQAQRRPGQVRFQSLRRWIELRNATYDSEPVRRFYFRNQRIPDGDALAQALAALYRDLDVNEHLKCLERELELYGNAVLLAGYDDDFRQVLLDRMISPRVRVVENQRNPMRPYATVLLGMIVERDAQLRGAYLPVADAWVEPVADQPGAYRAFRPSGDSRWQPLVLPAPPLVHCFDRRPTTDTGYYVDPLGLALARLNVCINEDFLSRYGYTVLLQGHGQLVIWGHNDQNPIQLGPGRAISFDGNPDVRQDLDFKTPGADLEGMRSAIEYLLRELRDVYGIPASEIDVGQDASGRSRIEARAPSAAVRRAKQNKMRAIETKLLRVLLMTASAFDANFPQIGAPEEYDIQVAFADPALSLAVSDQIVMERHELELGLVTPGELLLRRKPDMFDSVEEADAWVSARLEKKPGRPEGASRGAFAGDSDSASGNGS